MQQGSYKLLKGVEMLALNKILHENELQPEFITVEGSA
jgi:hypothetical protein